MDGSHSSNELSIVFKNAGYGARRSGLNLLRSCVLDQVTKSLWASDDLPSKREITAPTT